VRVLKIWSELPGWNRRLLMVLSSVGVPVVTGPLTVKLAVVATLTGSLFCRSGPVTGPGGTSGWKLTKRRRPTAVKIGSSEARRLPAKSVTGLNLARLRAVRMR
jgi:hypothetical protein